MMREIVFDTETTGVFPDHPEAEFRAYHAKYLPVAYGGTWMLRLAP